MSRLLERLKTDILVADGAMGTLLYANGLDNCYEAYNLTYPDKISAIHHAYLEAGADIIQTNTYAAKRHRLKGYAYDDQVKEINQAGVKLLGKLQVMMLLFLELLGLFVDLNNVI